MAELETRRREVLRNKRNVDRLSSLLAQLKEVQDDMMGGSDEEVASQVEAVANSVKSEKDSVDRSSSVVPCSTIVGGTTGFVVTKILCVRSTRPLDALEISMSDGRSSSVIPINTIVGVRGTRLYEIGDKSLETAVGGDASDAVLGGGSNVTTRDIREFRNKDSLDSRLRDRKFKR